MGVETIREIIPKWVDHSGILFLNGKGDFWNGVHM